MTSAVRESRTLEELRVADFAALVGTCFEVGLDAEPVELHLEEAEICGEARTDGGRVPFALVFIGPASPLLPQRMYSLGHASFGQVDLFLVPISATEEQSRYEAIFT